MSGRDGDSGAFGGSNQSGGSGGWGGGEALVWETTATWCAFSPLVYEAEPGVEWSWWLHAEIWEVWVWHRCRPVAEDPGLADGQSRQGGQMAVAARRL